MQVRYVWTECKVLFNGHFFSHVFAIFLHLKDSWLWCVTPVRLNTGNRNKPTHTQTCVSPSATTSISLYNNNFLFELKPLKCSKLK